MYDEKNERKRRRKERKMYFVTFYGSKVARKKEEKDVSGDVASE